MIAAALCRPFQPRRRRLSRCREVIALAAVCALGCVIVERQAVAATSGPSCPKAASAVAREICGSPELRAMDREIAALYDRGMLQLHGDDHHRLEASQQAYLHRRKGCDWAAHHSAHPGTAVEECVHTTLEERIRTLRAVADRGRY